MSITELSLKNQTKFIRDVLETQEIDEKIINKSQQLFPFRLLFYACNLKSRLYIAIYCSSIRKEPPNYHLTKNTYKTITNFSYRYNIYQNWIIYNENLFRACTQQECINGKVITRHLGYEKACSLLKAINFGDSISKRESILLLFVYGYHLIYSIIPRFFLESFLRYAPIVCDGNAKTIFLIQLCGVRFSPAKQLLRRIILYDFFLNLKKLC